ncbi:MAG: SMC-Scp complex subunit ScpB [Oscillospiraceae bacterium]|nr:SMC-Scp complex subunit ScpB [Oscillospiraceae bacterium]
MERYELEAAIEGILFAAGEPVPIKRLADALEVSVKEAEAAAERIGSRLSYERRGIRITKLDKLWQMTSAPELGDTIRAVLEERKPPPMSRAALEVLSLVAYYQPITRADIERIRGVESCATVARLIEKGLIAESGRLDVPGKPYLYKTTPHFLRAFGLTSLDDLPNPEDSEIEGQLSIEQPQLSSEDAGSDVQEGRAGGEDF